MQKSISFSYDSDLEVITSELQKVDIASSGQVTLKRPNKIHGTRTGGFHDVEINYDGSNLTVLGKLVNVYAKVPLTGTIDELIDMLRYDYGLELPAADLLSSSPDDVMMSNVIEMKDLGSGVIGGRECDHLAFRTADTDWQIWIAEGDKPYPCRFLITSKLVALAPSYTIDFRDWKDGDQVAGGDFSIDTGHATEIKIDEISALDDAADLPQGGEK
jgi:hypothetical protein